ncbi:heterokaryon incompatibility protein-domain-containing protein [Xylaria digitata]|nr:heterokaryon incompatibility protein-domain-containing protein [Xylaria digitata]
MICDCCMRIFELRDHFEHSGESVPHHASTQSFVSSVTAGCPICRAIISELDEPQKLLLDPNIISSTECFSLDIMEAAESNVQSYYLNFAWESRGLPRRYRGLLVERYHTIRPYLPRSPLEDKRGWTEQTLRTVKAWMHKCLEQHPKCRLLHGWRTSGSMFQPKRLVDVGAADGLTWRLVLREDEPIFPTPYATISHRWSTHQQFKLVSSNMQSYTDGQSLDILPQVFQDAIKVTRSLGIRYLWADCLCIIQDSLPDWEIESLEMCKIYSNSICNISITGFEDSSTGFLDDTCNYVPLPCRVQPCWARNIDEGWCVLDPFFWWSQVTKAPLTRRGWVFQERFLAPRVIHFSPEQLLWECASLDACEAFPQGLPAIVKSPRHTGFKRLDFLFENYSREGRLPAKGQLLSISEEDLLYQWCEIVQAYMRTSLTKPSDKLIALAGVAQLISQSNDTTHATISKSYLAGLFEQHLLLMLEWHSDGNMYSLPEPACSRPPHYRAPSWSWASIDGRVFYDYLPRKIDDDQQWARKTSWEMFLEGLNGHMDTENMTYWPVPSKCLGWRPLVFEMKSSITTVAESPFGQILDGKIELNGLLILSGDIINAFSRNPTSRPILLHLDAPTTPGRAEPNTLLLPLRCIQLRDWDDEEPFYWVTALLLEPVSADEPTYRRCGMLSILSTDGVREIGIELTESPFAAKYSAGTKLETVQVI